MKKTVCVDLDGVLADYSKGWQGIDKIGDPINGAKEFLQKLQRFARIVIYTTRCCTGVTRDQSYTEFQLEQRVRAWLVKHQLPFDDIYTGQGKPIASCISMIELFYVHHKMMHVLMTLL